MEKVASHINEMQKIYEDYGSVFDQLVAEQIGHEKEVTAGFFFPRSGISPPRPRFLTIPWLGGGAGLAYVVYAVLGAWPPGS